MVTIPRRPEYNPSYRLDPLTGAFAEDQFELDQRELAKEGAGRFAEPRIRRRVEDVQEYLNDSTPVQIAQRDDIPEEDDRHIAADAIIQAAADTAAGGWEPTRWDTSILQLPEQQEKVPTLGGRAQQPVRSPVPGIAVDTSGQQYPVQNVPPPGAIESLGAGAVLNVPLAATGFTLGAYETVANKFPELVDMLASGRYNTSDPEIISRAVDIAGLVTSGSFANRVAQEAGRTRTQQRVARSEETGEPFYVPDDITLNINSTRDGRFNIDAKVGDEQAVDLYVRNLQTRPNDPNAVLQFGHAYIDEPWQRQGIASAVQEHLEAATGRPFVPDNFLTQQAYDRWRKIDPDALVGHVKRQGGGGEIYWQRSTARDMVDGRPWTETPRMAEVRRAHAAGELRSPLGPEGEFTLRGAQPTSRGEFTLGMGAASDRGQGGGMKPRNLDPTGYYSHAEEAVGGMQRTGTPQQMWRSLEGQVRESEIRQLGLDEAVLGPALAGSRRFVMDQTADLARLRGELKDLGTQEGQDRFLKRQGHDKPENGHYPSGLYQLARERQAELERIIPVREEQLKGHRQRHEERMQEISGTRPSVNRDDILSRVQQNRPQVRETSYGVYQRPTEPQVRDAQRALAGPNRDWKPFMDELQSRPGWTPEDAGTAARMIKNEMEAGGKQLGATMSSLRSHYGFKTSDIGDAIHKLTGRSVNSFTVGQAPPGTRPLYLANATLDPANPTLRWRTLSTQGEGNLAIERLWRSIPDVDARTLRATWRDNPNQLINDLPPSQYNTVMETRRRHKALIERIMKEEERGSFIDPHFEEANVFGHYASSLQNLPDGGVTLTPHQIQSTWFDKLRAGKNISGNALVENMQSWLDPVLRRVIKDAVDQGATSITLPSAETVFRYNPPGEARGGLVRLYNEIIPRRLRAVMREMDEGYSSRGDKVDRLHTLEDASTQYRQEGQHSGTVRRMSGEIEDVRHGFRGSWLKFDLTPSVIRHHKQGRGMRLFSSGIPVPGEEDGPQD